MDETEYKKLIAKGTMAHRYNERDSSKHPGTRAKTDEYDIFYASGAKNLSGGPYEERMYEPLKKDFGAMQDSLKGSVTCRADSKRPWGQSYTELVITDPTKALEAAEFVVKEENRFAKDNGVEPLKLEDAVCRVRAPKPSGP